MVVYKDHLELSAPAHQDISSSMTPRPVRILMSVRYPVSAASSATTREEALGVTVQTVTS